VCLYAVYKDVRLEDYVAVPDDSCSVIASLDAASSVVPATLGVRPKPFDEAGFDVVDVWCNYSRRRQESICVCVCVILSVCLHSKSKKTGETTVN